MRLWVSGAFLQPESALNQAWARALFTSLPHKLVVVVRPRAAYPHPDSLGRRQRRSPPAEPFCRTLAFSHATYAFASCQLTHTTGSRSVCVKPGFSHVTLGPFCHLKMA